MPGRWFDVLRPRAMARTQKAVEDLVAEAQTARRTLKQVADSQVKLQEATDGLLQRLESTALEVKALQKEVSDLTLLQSQLGAVLRTDAELEAELSDVDRACNEEKLIGHIRRAVEAAELHLEPFPYIVIEGLFTDRYYQALLRGIPPIELFQGKPFNKQHVNVPFSMAPRFSRLVWNFFLYRVGPHLLVPALIKKFKQPLEEWIGSNWPELAADPFGEPMDLKMGDGRIMLRGRGYLIPPHRDPKWGFLTCLLYLAREQDNEAWGTQLYEVEDDEPAQGAAPMWIDASRCRKVADIPYRANTMLVFLNSVGAHGACIPEDAEPEGLQRYIYQCRIGPGWDAMRALMDRLPEDRVPLWAGKLADY